MDFATGLLRFLIIGVVVGSLVAIGFVFFAIVSVVLLVFGSLAWLRRNDVLATNRQAPVPPVDHSEDEVVVERKVIDAQFEEVDR